MASSSRATEPPVNEVPADARSVSDESDSSNEEGWEDVEPEDDSQPVVGLFSDVVFPDVRSMLKECKEKNNFDLVKIQKDLGMLFRCCFSVSVV
jgi:protein arginine N-methyltransferase 3